MYFIFKKNNSGYSIVETLVALGILTLIIVVITTFQKDIFSLNYSLQGSLNAQFEGGRVLRVMVGEIRSMSQSAAGAYPIAQAATSTMTFYTDIDNDGSKEKVRYYLQNGSLKKGVIDPSGNPVGYTGTEKIETLITNVVNATSSPIFSYYDSSYAGTTTPLSMPVDTLSVRLIKINVIIDKDANRPPSPSTVTSQVTPRNLKDNL